jgi:uncharacterized membrane protein
MSVGDALADKVASGMGSWAFIIWQTVLVVVWMALNSLGWFLQWDVYPFILLNLVFSTQAAYAAPIIMQSQNRQAERDRHHADADYQTNVAAKQEIEALQIHLSRIEAEKLDALHSKMDLLLASSGHRRSNLRD